MSTKEHPSIISKFLGFFGAGKESDTEASLRHTGDQDGALTMSKEPTEEEIVRTAAEKNDPPPRKG